MGEVFRLDDISMFLFRMYHDGKFHIFVADGFLRVQELIDIIEEAGTFIQAQQFIPVVAAVIVYIETPITQMGAQ